MGAPESPQISDGVAESHANWQKEGVRAISRVGRSQHGHHHPSRGTEADAAESTVVSHSLLGAMNQARE